MGGMSMRKLIAVLLIGFAAISTPVRASTVDWDELLARLEALEARVAELEARLGIAPPEPDAAAESSNNSSVTEWRQLGQNWEYRNPTIRSAGGMLSYFLVEMRRTGPPVTTAMFTVTLYDDQGRIITTGSATLFNMTPGQVKVAEFLLRDSVSAASRFRLQVDVEF